MKIDIGNLESKDLKKTIKDYFYLARKFFLKCGFLIFGGVLISKQKKEVLGVILLVFGISQTLVFFMVYSLLCL